MFNLSGLSYSRPPELRKGGEEGKGEERGGGGEEEGWGRRGRRKRGGAGGREERERKTCTGAGRVGRCSHNVFSSVAPNNEDVIFAMCDEALVAAQERRKASVR